MHKLLPPCAVRAGHAAASQRQRGQQVQHVVHQDGGSQCQCLASAGQPANRARHQRIQCRDKCHPRVGLIARPSTASHRAVLIAAPLRQAHG